MRQELGAPPLRRRLTPLRPARHACVSALDGAAEPLLPWSRPARRRPRVGSGPPIRSAAEPPAANREAVPGRRAHAGGRPASRRGRPSSLQHPPRCARSVRLGAPERDAARRAPCARPQIATAAAHRAHRRSSATQSRRYAQERPPPLPGQPGTADTRRHGRSAHCKGVRTAARGRWPSPPLPGRSHGGSGREELRCYAEGCNP